MSTSDPSLDALVIDRSDDFVHVTLNRPQALNALNLDMIDRLLPILQGGDAVLVTGAGGKAFCAGGDVKTVWQVLKTGDVEGACDYFRHEYRMNAALFAHTSPYVSFLNGIVMGGGYGISAHGSHLIATEATQFAMPEVKIGFFPDVGVMYHLARAPQELGTWLALTGNTVNGADMMFAGLAHAYVPTQSFFGFKAAMAADGIEAALAQYAVPAPQDGLLARHAEVIAQCFAGNSIEHILEALKVEGSAFALQTASEIETRCPLSLKVSLRHLRLSAKESFDTVIARDLFLARRFMESPDFMEGVRAALIDKDRRPRWNPAALEQVDEALLALYFPDDRD